MSGRRPFTELTKDFSPERRARVEARKAELRAAMPLHELRQARALTQKALGETLEVNQPAFLWDFTPSPGSGWGSALKAEPSLRVPLPSRERDTRAQHAGTALGQLIQGCRRPLAAKIAAIAHHWPSRDNTPGKR